MPRFQPIHLLIVPLLLFFTKTATAQYSQTIQSGRPGQSIVAGTVGKGMLQFQQGLIFSRAKMPGLLLNGQGGMVSKKDFRYTDTYTSENVVRYGLAERIELNASINYDWQEVHGDKGVLVVGKNGGYLSSADVGVRASLYGQEGIWPATAVQARLKTGQYVPEGNYKVKDVEINAAFAWQLAARHGLTLNLIPTINVSDVDANRYNYTLAYSFSVAPAWSVFIENYGGYVVPGISDNFFVTYVDGGLAWMVNNNLQLDLLGGYGQNEQMNTEVTSFFVSAGVSWRVKTNN